MSKMLFFIISREFYCWFIILCIAYITLTRYDGPFPSSSSVKSNQKDETKLRAFFETFHSFWLFPWKSYRTVVLSTSLYAFVTKCSVLCVVLSSPLRKKTQLRKVKRTLDIEERMLFHGTGHSNIQAICTFNFDWRLTGSHGDVYGKGRSFCVVM